MIRKLKLFGVHQETRKSSSHLLLLSSPYLHTKKWFTTASPQRRLYWMDRGSSTLSVLVGDSVWILNNRLRFCGKNRISSGTFNLINRSRTQWGLITGFCDIFWLCSCCHLDHHLLGSICQDVTEMESNLIVCVKAALQSPSSIHSWELERLHQHHCHFRHHPLEKKWYFLVV